MAEAAEMLAVVDLAADGMGVPVAMVAQEVTAAATGARGAVQVAVVMVAAGNGCVVCGGDEDDVDGAGDEGDEYEVYGHAGCGHAACADGRHLPPAAVSCH